MTIVSEVAAARSNAAGTSGWSASWVSGPAEAVETPGCGVAVMVPITVPGGRRATPHARPLIGRPAFSAGGRASRRSPLCAGRTARPSDEFIGPGSMLGRPPLPAAPAAERVTNGATTGAGRRSPSPTRGLYP